MAQVFCGLTGAIIGSMAFGTASLPFICAACFGFTMGTVRWYHVSVTQALLSLDAYPALLRLHLDSNYPSRGFRKSGLNMFRSEVFRDSWILKSMLIVSWLTAQPAIDV